MGKQVMIVKADGEQQLFRPQKLRDSLSRSGASLEEINAIVSQVEDELMEGMTTREIYKRAFKILQEYGEKGVAGKYSLREAILQMGPSGYPFEDFIAELFRRKGYSAHSSDFVPGKCVQHEMDIIACKDGKELIMAETKFHNVYGLKSDIQDVLYTKARFDDIKGGHFQYYGRGVLDAGWLITNTKFSAQAIQYGQCAGINLLGWKHPQDAGLEIWIQEAGLLPITCLSTLSLKQKQLLMKQGIIIKDEIFKNIDELKNIGLSGREIDFVLEEAKML